MTMQERVILGLIVAVPLDALVLVLVCYSQLARKWAVASSVLAVSTVLLAVWVVGAWPGLVVGVAGTGLALGSGMVAVSLAQKASIARAAAAEAPLHDDEEEDEEPVRRKRARPGMKWCPYCAEEIRKEAIKCRFCGEALAGDLPAAPAPRKKSSGRVVLGGMIFTLAALSFLNYACMDTTVPVPRSDFSGVGAPSGSTTSA